ncbi:MAG: outer membrane beta-barrel protein [Caulobacterales bacterium]|nr:outer membrane beta-barrel protein [Caulobacterales bacterium]
MAAAADRPTIRNSRRRSDGLSARVFFRPEPQTRRASVMRRNMARNVTSLAFVAAGVAAVAASDVAEAQFIGEGRNVAVRERARPGYEADGVQMGAFVARPVTQLRGRYDDNIFAADRDAPDTGDPRSTETADFINDASFRTSIETIWPVHSIYGFGSFNYLAYADNEDENRLNAEVGAGGRYDITSRSAVGTRFSASRRHEGRQSSNSPVDSVDPIRFDVLSTSLNASQTFDQVRLRGSVDYRDFSYQDGRDIDGDVIEQGFRDRGEVYVTGRGEYAISPDSLLFFQVGGNDRSYDQTTNVLDRSSTGYDILTGAAFDITNLVRGEVGIGYFTQNFDDTLPGADDTLDGFDLSVDVDWFVTQLTTVTLGAARDVAESSLLGSSGYLATSARVSVDHEYLPNLLFSGAVDYVIDDYQGIDREDNRYGVALGATYLFNERYGFDFSVARSQQESTGDAAGGVADYDINSVEATFRMAL